MKHRMREEGGAAAVELAVMVPLIMLLVFGLIAMGRLFNTQVSFTSAAREGARTMAVTNDAALATTAAIDAAPTVVPALTAAEVSVSSCSPGADATVTITRPVAYDVPLWGSFAYNVQGIGVMRCGG